VVRGKPSSEVPQRGPVHSVEVPTGTARLEPHATAGDARAGLAFPWVIVPLLGVTCDARRQYRASTTLPQRCGIWISPGGASKASGKRRQADVPRPDWWDCQHPRASGRNRPRFAVFLRSREGKPREDEGLLAGAILAQCSRIILSLRTTQS